MIPIFRSQKTFDLEVARRAAAMCEQVTTEMGAELHDDLIQKLSIIRLHLDRLERSAHSRNETEQLLIQMRTDFDIVTKSVRRISRKVLPVQPDPSSFSNSIRLLCQNLEGPGFCNIYFESTGREFDIENVQQIHIYRIVQELVHNAFKHSAAWHIWVRLKWTTKLLTIEVEDDGTGFHKISEFIGQLRSKHNTLWMRSNAIGATISFTHGKKGLLARLEFGV